MRLQLAFLALAVGLAQQSQPPIFRTGTSLVRVDVTVTDRTGKPVRDLTSDDFEVREEGRPQAITSFKLVDATGEPTDDLSLPIRSPAHAAAEAARDDVRVFVIFWDEYHIEAFRSARLAREQLERLVIDSFGPTDLVALVDPLTPLDAIRFSRDRRALADQIHRLKGRRGVYIPPRSVMEEGHLRARIPIERVRAEITTSALKAVMMHLGAIREGRKSVFLISETFGPLGRDEATVLSDLMRTANHNNTAVYTFDPRGLMVGGRASAALYALAEQSGGIGYSSNDMTPALRRVVSHASAFYLLGYGAPESPMDGKFRRISVKVKRGSVDVHARSGYWQARPEEMTRARELAEAAKLPEPVAAAMEKMTPSNSHRPVDLWTGVTPGAGNRATVTVAWAPRGGAPAAKDAPASLDLEARVDGGLVHTVRVDAAGATFEVPAGDLQLTILTRNAAGEIIDREQRKVAVPSADTPLAFGTPAVSRARNAREVRAQESGEAAVTAARDFGRTERLRVRVAAYGTASAGAAVTAALLSARGVKLADLAARPAAAAGHYDVDLQLGSLAPGEFIIRVEAVAAEHRAESLVAFRVR